MTTLPLPSPTSLPAKVQAQMPLRDAAPSWLKSTGWNAERREPEPWTCPAILSPGQIEAANKLLAESAPRFAPALSSWIVARVSANLSLYWQDQADADAEKNRLALWTKHLAEYPQALIERAFTKWERSKRIRPTPSEIRELAEDAGGDDWAIYKRLRQAANRKPGPHQDALPDRQRVDATPEEQAAVKAQMEAFYRKMGWTQKAE